MVFFQELSETLPCTLNFSENTVTPNLSNRSLDVASRRLSACSITSWCARNDKISSCLQCKISWKEKQFKPGYYEILTNFRRIIQNKRNVDLRCGPSPQRTTSRLSFHYETLDQLVWISLLWLEYSDPFILQSRQDPSRLSFVYQWRKWKKQSPTGLRKWREATTRRGFQSLFLDICMKSIQVTAIIWGNNVHFL